MTSPRAEESVPEPAKEPNSSAASLIPPRAPAPVQTRPWCTWVCCAICIVVFVALVEIGQQGKWEQWSPRILPDAVQIWDGAYWTLLTSVFVHLQWWHVALNVCCLWVLGRPLELAIGSFRWLIFFVLAAVVSSGFQFAAADQTGIGASGVAYALVGFMWVTRRHYPQFAKVLPPNIIVLALVWLVACYIATVLNIFAVGNAAHLSGLLFGVSVGFACVLKKEHRLGLLVPATLIALSIVPLFWCPWSATWVSKQAFDAHTRGDLATAVRRYQESLRLGQDPSWVWENLVGIYHQQGNYEELNKALSELRGRDHRAAERLEKELQLVP
jgi:GlpG protein